MDGLVATKDAHGVPCLRAGVRYGDFAAILPHSKPAPAWAPQWIVIHVGSGGELLGPYTADRAEEVAELVNKAYQEEWLLPRLERHLGVSLLNFTEWCRVNDWIDDAVHHLGLLHASA